MASVAVLSLMRTLELEFLQPHPRPILQQTELLIPSNKELIQSIHQKLGCLIELFDENRMDAIHQAIKGLETKLRDVAFSVEDEIEFQIAHLYDDTVEEESAGTAQRDTDAEKSCPSSKLRRILQQAIEEIDAIKKGLVKIKNQEDKLLQGRKTGLDVLPRSEAHSSQPPASDSDNKMVGKDEEFESIKEMLIQRSSKKLEVVLIKGMGGIGKTTLARRAYRDKEIASHYDRQAWGVASQHHNKRQMLLALLNSMGYAGGSNDDEARLALKLYRYLKKQRYLVVIDDVWSNEAWDDVKNCFPDDGCGSRVLLTTRLEEVARSTCSNKKLYHEMSFLNQNESWNLFSEKACKVGDDEFEMIGKQIVEKCNGLPLAILVVAGVLSKLNTVDRWKDIAESLNSFATIIDEKCSTILSFSYNHLSPTLKACFLYLGVFPEDYEINTKDLAKLWAAEGLVKASEDESLDLIIEKHIQELLDRSLILESKRSCCGSKVKAFTMHDLLHAFCVQEAQKEKLLYIMDGHGSGSPQKDIRWVSIQSKDPNTLAMYPSLKNCRSIFYFPFYPSEMATLNLKIFKLLRVLYFTSGSMCREIVDLIHLRYLPPAIGQFKISKLSKTWNLQTLYIRVDDKKSYLKFPQLQYFSCFSICGHPPKFVHQNLQSICWMKPNHCTEEFFRNVPNLKMVRISGDRSKCNDCIENLAHLKQLERLNINAYEEEHYMMNLDMIPINDRIADLSNLEKLTLRNTNFEWKGINILSSLPKLKVLKLFFFACVGEEWELLEDEVFSELIYLGINSIDLKQWTAADDNFPELQHLILYQCKKLEQIPVAFSEISTLKLIELKGCLPSAVTSAEQIDKNQKEFQNNHDMVVIEEDTIQPNEELEPDEDDFDELR